jgi:exopolysaccharide biosynthesis polyprenyl glycosylphosphotransferase
VGFAPDGQGPRIPLLWLDYRTLSSSSIASDNGKDFTRTIVLGASAKRIEKPLSSAFADVQRKLGDTPQFSLVRRQGAWRDALLRRMLALADLGAALLASTSLLIAEDGKVSHALWSALLAPVWLVIAKLVGLYDRDQRALRHLTVDELPKIFTWALFGAATITLLLSATPAGELSAGEAVRAGLAAIVGGLVFRAIARYVWRRLTPPERVVVIGDGALATAARRKLELFPDMHLVVIGELPELTVEALHDHPAALNEADRILVATPNLDERLIAELLAFCRRRQVKLSVVPPARRMFGRAVELSHVADLPVVEYNTWDVSRSTLLLKRIVDLVISSIMLAVLSPLMLLIVCLVVIDGGRPVLFTQTRVGQSGRPFRMLKFRTMVQNAEQLLPELVPFDELDEPMFKLARDPRVTSIGRLLRRASLDELPQLLNVLRGDMSLVGPRPEQIELVERYSDEHLVRLAVKPGLTGPMQVYGRGQLTFEERLAVEREYIENISVARDLHILALTVGSVVNGRGAF